MTSTQNLWQSSEWKETRNRLIKSYCEQCGDKTKIMVLTHENPFPKALSTYRKVRQRFIERKILENKIMEFKLPDEQILNFSLKTCPYCESSSLRERKVKLPKYQCKKCSQEFNDTNEKINYNSLDYVKLLNSHYKVEMEPYEDEFQKEYSDAKVKLVTYYLSGKDTITLCRSCSYQKRKGRVLCNTCNKNFHTKNYDKCFLCNSVLCDICKENRIPISHNKLICDNCKIKKTSKKKCKLCKDQFETDLDICDNCILAGHWTN